MNRTSVKNVGDPFPPMFDPAAMAWLEALAQEHLDRDEEAPEYGPDGAISPFKDFGPDDASPNLNRWGNKGFYHPSDTVQEIGPSLDCYGRSTAPTDPPCEAPTPTVPKSKRGRPVRLVPHLTASDYSTLCLADRYALDLQKDLGLFLTLHPAYLGDDHPGDDRIGPWLQTCRARISTFLNRSGVGTYAIGVRENFQAPRREHWHALYHCPAEFRPGLRATVLKSYPSAEPELIDLKPRYSDGVISYIAKQMIPDDARQLGIRCQMRDDKGDSSPVAPVIGSRLYVSKSLQKGHYAAD